MIAIVEAWVVVLVVVPSLLVLLYPLSVHLARRRFQRLRSKESCWPDLSVIVPVKGLDAGARYNFESLFSQDYPGKFEIIFALEDEFDPAVELIRKVMSQYPKTDSTIVLSGAGKEYTGKIHNLVEGLRVSRGEAIMFVDSDVRMTSKNYFSRFVGPLRREEVGLVTCYQAVSGAESLGAGLIAVMTNADLIGYFSVLYAFGKLNMANGAILSIRREVVDRIGGLADLRNTVLNDTAIARKIGKLGQRIVLADVPARVYSARSTVSEWWQQVSRWHIAMNSYMRPLEYARYGLTRLAMLAAVLYFVMAPLTTLSVCVLALPIAARTVSLALINLLFLRDRSTWKYFGLIYLIDLFNIVFLLTPFFTRKIMWRGRSYRVGKHATLEPLGID